MNARRRAVPDGLPNRVYEKSGSYYWFPKGGSWIKLCRVSDGQRKMLERLAAEMKKREVGESGTGNIPFLVAQYVEAKKHYHREKGWPNYATQVKKDFLNSDVADVTQRDVKRFLRNNWPDKLPMQRAMRAFLTGFFQWCYDQEHIDGPNPCQGIKLKKPDERDVYITDAHFSAIRAGLADYPMVLCLVDLCYLTAQRSTEIRSLLWKKEDDDSNWIDRDAGVIHFKPSKTMDSSGLAIDWPITPEIDAVLETARAIGKIKGKFVLHTRRGTPLIQQNALKVWREACDGAKLQQYAYTIKDIRAKAITDAARAGYDIEALKEAAAHTDTKTTEIYLKQRQIPLSNVRLAIPKSA